MFYLLEEFRWQRSVLAGLGREDQDAGDDLLHPEPTRPAAAGEARLAEVAAFVSATGGDMG